MHSKFFLFILAFSLTFTAFGQRNTAALSGTTTDQTGATVSNAHVTAVQISTGASSRAQSNESGFYLLPNLPPGNYTVRIEHAGFESYVQQGIVLEVDQSATVNFSLKIGSQTQSVTVTGEPPLVDTRSQTLTTVVTPEMAQQLPLNGRNVLQLLALVADVSPGGTRCFAQGASRPESSVSFISSSGARSNETAYYLDGGINEDPYTEIANIFPNPDAIQEFSVQTNSYSARFGGRGGGVVNAETRSGANQFHGSAFEFLRNSDLNARNFFAAGTMDLRGTSTASASEVPSGKIKPFSSSPIRQQSCDRFPLKTRQLRQLRHSCGETSRPTATSW